MNCKVYFYELKKFYNCRYKKVLSNIQKQRSWGNVQDFHPKLVFSRFRSWWRTCCIVYNSKLNAFRSILRLTKNENTCTLQKSLKENENTCARNPSKRVFPAWSHIARLAAYFPCQNSIPSDIIDTFKYDNIFMRSNSM